jgi:hypothetical protein
LVPDGVATHHAMIVWVFVVLGFLSFGDGQPSLMGQANHRLVGRFVFPTRLACEAAREGVREFAWTADQTLLIEPCLEEARARPVSTELADLSRH